MKKMKVAALGDNCVDIYPRLGRYYCTGNVVDFAVHMQRLGIPTSVISTTGDDVFGRQLVRELKMEDIDTSHLKVVPGLTAVSYMDLIDRERTYGDYVEGVMENVEFDAEDIRFVCDHDLVHTAIWGNATEHLPQIHESGTKISFDYADELTDPLVEQTIPYVDYAFFSFVEHTAETEEYLKDKVRRGAKTAVATFGDKGSLAWDGEQFHSFGVFPTTVENTVGAGDSFIAGFMNGVLRGWSVEKCMEQGAAVSAQVVSIFDPWERRPIQVAD